MSTRFHVGSKTLVLSFGVHQDHLTFVTGTQRALIRNPLVPLIFRIVISSFSLVALALGGSIFVLSRTYRFSQRPSTIIAIAFDAVALLYIFWITHDEYRGKPLGLRSPAAKMRLVLLDLFFIVFNSANLSLSFDALTDVRWSCRSGPMQESEAGSFGDRIDALCDRQRALSGVLFVALLAWLLTFSVSVFRYVHVTLIFTQGDEFSLEKVDANRHHFAD